jgi:hypothetical protein
MNGPRKKAVLVSKITGISVGGGGGGGVLCL